jgi:hypothetical protein
MNIPICTCRACANKLATLRDMVFDKWFMVHHPNVAQIYEETGMEVLEIAKLIGIEDLYYTEMTAWSADQEYARERLELIREGRELIRAFQAMIPPVDGDEEDNDPDFITALQNSQTDAHKEYKTEPEELSQQFLDDSKFVLIEKTPCLGCFDELEGNAFKVRCRNKKCEPIFCKNCFQDFLCTTRTTEHYICPLCKGTFALDAHSAHSSHPAHLEHPAHLAHPAHPADSEHSAHPEHPAHPDHPAHSAQQEDEVKPESGLASAANS